MIIAKEYSKMKPNYDVIVVGAGHAGLEASLACAHLGFQTALITLNEQGIGLAPCNPSIGGPAKGVVTREIDALGGMQAIAADMNQLQMKLLNSSKGPGVWALRAQIDKIEYHNWFVKVVGEEPNLDVIYAEATSLIADNNQIKGVVLNKEININAKAVILTTGTYLKSVCHQGEKHVESGPDGFNRAENLSDSLVALGFKLIRLKTGTPPRILKDSVDYSRFEYEPGTNKQLSFSHFNKHFMPFEEQEPCWILHTTDLTKAIIEKNLTRSAMYGGYIKTAVGPRYCPSIEDKVVKFNDKPCYQLFIEPESRHLDTIYLDGFSTSMPVDVQDEMIRSLPGFENCVVKKYAYAIEYDAIDPTQLYPSLQSKLIKGLFFAGQINGTSGYEEAAGQGLIAGINAAQFIRDKAPLILKRHESYIGVMIDDIVTKGITEPYRLLTSRAEHRLALRNDNALDRLIQYGYDIGLVKQENYDIYLAQNQLMNDLIKQLKNIYVGQIKALGDVKKNNVTLYEYLKRPEVKIEEVLTYINIDPQTIDQEILDKIQIQVKFEGYIKVQNENLQRLSNLDKYDLTGIHNYKEVPNITLEAIDKLNKIKPINLDQASRISGINLTDIARIKYYLDVIKNKDQ